MQLNETHDVGKRSWLDSANQAETDFPIQNLPFCVFRRACGGTAAIGVGIGDQILDLAAALESGAIPRSPGLDAAAAQTRLNALMALDRGEQSSLRKKLSALLDASCDGAQRERAAGHLVPMRDAELLLPVEIGDYTDFLTSAWHTERHGRFKGLQDPLPKAFFSLPVAYHGRASSIRVSGTHATRPWGQIRDAQGGVRFAPSEAMDFELELAAFVGQGNQQGRRVEIGRAGEHLFGYCLMNDWSAKDIQWWEQVLGPFLGKSFMTVVSPWVVTAEALAPYRGRMDPRPAGTAAILPHLAGGNETLDLVMEAWLQTSRMRGEGTPGVRLTRTNPRNLSWNFEQMLAHHTSNGCNLRTGDLLGSGTVSGASDDAMGCMTEMTSAGASALQLPNGETRSWLQDGDEVFFRARAAREGFASIGFGECRSRILPANAGDSAAS
ncbi:Fumarylacetoacetate (FAA) hydrolase family protein [Pigmentiphaga humi]|uniref:fumarylacetoacetase n=1 Tax=Pigmentiphaga humi TaxID=2478468 RepID=A0A3P4AY39_9BURK|nr:fumarylacetoacetase [Pigmentiphaga humi]VCU68963.1 Fumarylacetoacetate (FAA) hydrolase family protein [Pigmentiphaga humi]